MGSYPQTRVPGTALVYISSYTNKGPVGISVFSFNEEDGTMELIDRIDGIENPSFLAIDQKNRYFYAVSEVMQVDGKKSGKVIAYKIDPQTGKLSYLNEQLTGGSAPCHLSINRKGDQLFAVNYAGGNICAFPIDENGAIGELADSVRHEGSSIREDRQEGPHPHSIMLDPTDQFAFVPDLGIDKIMIYQLDDPHRKLSFYNEEKTQPGAGPRHFVFHPTRSYAYLVNELDCTITVYAYNEGGSLTALQTVPTLSQGLLKGNTCADIHIAPSGRFLYVSNRGHDSISIFKINEETGELAYLDHSSTRGKTPRNFALSPDGSFLIAANQDTDTVVTFKIDQESGLLLEPVSSIEVSEPVCIKFLNLERMRK
jgi:6-phosphogluconolactonase